MKIMSIFNTSMIVYKNMSIKKSLMRGANPSSWTISGTCCCNFRACFFVKEITFSMEKFPHSAVGF